MALPRSAIAQPATYHCCAGESQTVLPQCPEQVVPGLAERGEGQVLETLQLQETGSLCVLAETQFP